MNVIAGYAAAMKPGESQTIRSDWRRRNVIIPGTLADVSLRVVWVTFSDGTQWGARARPPHPPEPPPPPPPPDAPDAPNERDREPRVVVRGGAASGRGAGAGEGSGGGTGGGVGAGGGGGGQKLYAPQPEYPPIAKAAGAEGAVSVKVLVDEEGDVIAAEAVSGHPLLRTAAVAAAHEAKFKPTVVDGRPVRVSGVISYNFTLK